MRNESFNHKSLFTFCLFKHRNVNKQNKTKVLLKFIKVLIYLLGGGIANHVNFMQPMLVSYLSYYFSPSESDIDEV